MISNRPLLFAQSECPVATGFAASDISGTSAVVSWDPISGVEGYKVRYRVSGTGVWAYKKITRKSRILNNLSPNTSYTWEVKTYCTVDPGWSSDYSAKQKFTTGPVRLADESVQKISLQVYPNPAADQATIHFTLAQSSHTYISVYDLSGKEIGTLLNGDLEQGDHSLSLNINHFSKGVYLVKLITDSGIENQKLIVQ